MMCKFFTTKDAKDTKDTKVSQGSQCVADFAVKKLAHELIPIRFQRSVFHIVKRFFKPHLFLAGALEKRFYG